jgi:cellulose biosynthesis protein BcsQ
MPERVVAFATSPTRLVRLVGEQNALGNQVMAALLNPHTVRGYVGRNPYPVVGDPLEGFEVVAPAAPVGEPYAPAPAGFPAPEETAVFAPDAGAAVADPAAPVETPAFAAPVEAPPAFAPPPPSAAPPPLTPVGAVQSVAPRATGGPGQVFAVYSPRGGAGTSLLAATLASRIAQDPSLRVLLVDLDLQNGSQSYYFDVTEQRRCSVLGLKPLIDEILIKCDGDLNRVVAEAPSVLSDEILMAKTFERENLHVLCALDDPAAIDDYVDPSTHMEALIAVLGNSFDVVVLDLPNTVDQFTAPALFRSDRIVVVTPEDIPSQIKVARMLNLVLAPMIEAREMALQERCFLVVSRSGKKKLEVPMPIGIASALPEDKKFLENFAEKHQPFSKAGNSNYPKAVSQLATFLGAGPASAKGKK